MAAGLRRSWLLAPVSRTTEVGAAARSGADVVVLDLAELVAEHDKPAARERLQAAMATVHAGGAEVFVQIDPELTYADLHAAVWPGLAGIVVSRAESPRQITDIDTQLGELEDRRGLLPASVQIIAALETARGNHAAHAIGGASKRIWGLTLGRADLVMDLRPEPSGEIHFLPYLMQRLVIVANAVGAVPLGAWWREPDRGLLATPENTLRAARRGRAAGFRGALCLRANQVAALNTGFTPDASEMAAARALLNTHEQGVITHGSTVVIAGEHIIDRGAARRARALLDHAAAPSAQK